LKGGFVAMADINHDQRMRLDEIRTAHEDRLAALRLQAAQAGRTTPPEVINEIRQIEKDLRLANGIDDASDTMLELLGRFAQRRATDALVLEIQADMRDLQRSVRYLWYAWIGSMVAAALVVVYVAGRVGVL
jgi:hypothetical protein